ncbi:MAG: hypothetical protein ACFFCZ_17875 [Promethearchaeota archaeon]
MITKINWKIAPISPIRTQAPKMPKNPENISIEILIQPETTIPWIFLSPGKLNPAKTTKLKIVRYQNLWNLPALAGRGCQSLSFITS